MRMLTMIMHFHSAVTESPGAIFTEISQRRWCYVTAAVDPAVHITNASHCGGVTCFIQATSRRQQQQCSSCYYSLVSVTQDHAEPCSSHTATSSAEQPCSAPQHFAFHLCLSNTNTGDNDSYYQYYSANPPSNAHIQETLVHSYRISTGQPSHAVKRNVKKTQTHFCPEFHICCQLLAVYTSTLPKRMLMVPPPKVVNSNNTRCTVPSKY